MILRVFRNDWKYNRVVGLVVLWVLAVRCRPMILDADEAMGPVVLVYGV